MNDRICKRPGPPSPLRGEKAGVRGDASLQIRHHETRRRFTPHPQSLSPRRGEGRLHHAIFPIQPGKRAASPEFRVRSSLFLFLLAFSLLSPALSRAANTGSEVVVIYNTKVPESKSLAEYYAARRHVPTNKIFGFALSTGDEMSRAEFRDALQKPLA